MALRPHARLAGWLLSAGCASGPEAAPPPPPSAPALGPSVVAPPPPRPTASAVAASALPPTLVRFVEWNLRGLEARVAAAPLRGARPAVEACARGSYEQQGWLHLDATVSAAGALAGKVSSDELPAATIACVERAFQGLALEGAIAASASVSIWISFAREGAALPSLSRGESLVRSPKGACLGVEQFDCPPNKHCSAPERRAVECPEEHGLPARSALDRAERRLELAVAGGKTGQGLEELALWIHQGACVAEKRVVPVEGPLGAPAREALDVPCAQFERVWTLAQKKLVGLKPKGAPNQLHAVTHGFALHRATAGGARSVHEARWSGDAGKADEAFSEVAQQAGAVVRGRGTLTLGRF